MIKDKVRKINNRRSDEEIEQRVLKLGYSLVCINYINGCSKITFKDNEGYYYINTLTNLERNHLPSKFHKSNPYTIQNIKLWLQILL